MRVVVRLLAILTLFASASGCGTTQGVRYVYQDRDFGVVGLPENTDLWPTHYRRQAEALMNAHFPEGHEVVRAEEVVEGTRTLKTEGTSTAELSPQLPMALIHAMKFGHTDSRSQADTVKVKECRIIYHRAGGPDVPDGYAAAAALSPSLYLDPNALERRKASEKPEEKDKKAGDHKADDKTAKPAPKTDKEVTPDPKADG